MTTKGTFGYIIGRKKRMMYVENDADLLWQILVREIYILMQHFKTKESLEEVFEEIRATKPSSIPKKPDIEKNKLFIDFSKDSLENVDWYSLLHFCQSSYMNLLHAERIINEKEERGLIFMLDFNKGTVQFYEKKWDGTIEELNNATIEEIMEFADMPTKSYNEIISDMTANFNDYYTRLNKLEYEVEKLSAIMYEAKKQCSFNIEEKATKMLDTINVEKTKLHLGRRVFYNRLKALDLLEEPEEPEEAEEPEEPEEPEEHKNPEEESTTK